MSIYKRSIDTDVVKFISELKKHECLWNVECKNYKRRTAKASRAWLALGGIMGKPVADLRNKWKNLKDSYRKELKKNFSDGEYQGIWVYFEHLDFIRNSIVAGEKTDEMGSDDESYDEVPVVRDPNSIYKQKYNGTVVKLIHEVKKHRCLWNKECRVTGSTRNMAWQEVAEALGKPVRIVQTKWKNIKDTYRKDRAKNFDGEYKGQWQYFDLMSFLKIDSTNIADFDATSDNNSLEGISETPSENLIQTNVKIEVEAIDDYDHSDFDYFGHHLPETTKIDDEYDLMFLRSLLPFFKGMNDIRKLALRSEIQNMLMNELAASKAGQQT